MAGTGHDFITELKEVLHAEIDLLTECMPLEFNQHTFSKFLSSKMSEVKWKHQKQITRARHLEEEKQERIQRRKNKKLIIDHPCIILGVTYKTFVEARTQLNISSAVLKNRLRSHYWPEWVSEAFPKKISVRARKTEATSCEIEGVSYPSMGAAAKALNMSVGSLFHRLYSDNYPTYKVKNGKT